MTGSGKTSDTGGMRLAKRLLHLVVAGLIVATLVYNWRNRHAPPSLPESVATATAKLPDAAGDKPAEANPGATASDTAKAGAGTGAGAGVGAGSGTKADADPEIAKDRQARAANEAPGASTPPQQQHQAQAQPAPAETSPKSAARDGGSLFRDGRALSDAAKPAGAAQAPPAAPGGGPFRDARPLSDAPAAVPSFQDQRPLLAEAGGRPPRASPAPSRGGMFADPRALTAPSFRDERPMLSAEQPQSAATPQGPAANATPAAAPQAPAQAATAPAAAAPQPASAPPVAAQAAPAQAAPVQAAPAQAASVQASPTPASPPQASPTAGQPPRSTIVAVNAPPLRVDAGACSAPELSSEPLDGGRMRILVSASCRPGEAVQVSYGGAELIRKLDGFGRLDMILDCFAGADGQVMLRFADGTQHGLPVTTRDLDKLSKIAVIWHAPVNLDLHVFEYAARYNQPGHIWSKAASNLAAARAQTLGDRRGHGFLSTVDDETSLGDKVEVYTFLHSDEQTSGAISLALDYETRGEMPTGATCGQGALAEIDFQVVMLPRGGHATRQPGVLTRVDCGRPIAREARLNQSALPGLRIRR